MFFIASYDVVGMGYTAGTGVATALMNVQWPTINIIKFVYI